MADTRIWWFKFSNSFMNDDKIKLIKQKQNGRSIVLFFIELLAIASNQNLKGKITINKRSYNAKELSILLDIKDVQFIEDALALLKDQRMIKINKKRIEITNWIKYQSHIEKYNDRKEKDRKRQRKKRQRDKELKLKMQNFNSESTSSFQPKILSIKNQNTESDAS